MIRYPETDTLREDNLIICIREADHHNSSRQNQPRAPGRAEGSLNSRKYMQDGSHEKKGFQIPSVEKST
jgi:hypothetical protein